MERELWTRLYPTVTRARAPARGAGARPAKNRDRAIC
jgi:hypothetical protein